MPSKRKQSPVPGSERTQMAGSHLIGPADPGQRLEVTVRIRPHALHSELPSTEELGETLPTKRQYLSRDELAAIQGADPEDLEKPERGGCYYRGRNITVIS